ncbi:hypothetical protein Tcan_12999 [Toxocara canis]|uniref:Uncharacterized protein n=1 Tax=Toxocara canis TaxID=6265 RepID=A0A0B2V967_TOXCA|nr:hypothetical protein Tcan_12999 [Toxocara canis]
MSTLLSLFFLSILTLKGVCEPLRSDNCRISETMVLLHYGDVHEVPICFPIVKHRNGEKWEDSGGKSMRYNRFKCEKHECALCRCDISRGYKLSNDSRSAECVMMCPITKHFSKRCFKFGTARMCTY